jgi:hypothetical protein
MMVSLQPPLAIAARDVAALLDRLTPHTHLPGADALLRLCLRLLLAGGTATLSYTDLTALLACNRASVAAARRLGESLGLLICAAGARLDHRPGPAPLTWRLVLTGTSAQSEPVRDPSSATEPATDAGTELVSPLYQIPDPVESRTDPFQIRSDAAVPARVSPPDTKLEDLLAHAHAVTGERQRWAMDQLVGPVLEQLLAAGWSGANLIAEIDRIARFMHQKARPARPSSYLASALRQHLDSLPGAPAPAIAGRSAAPSISQPCLPVAATAEACTAPNTVVEPPAAPHEPILVALAYGDGRPLPVSGPVAWHELLCHLTLVRPREAACLRAVRVLTGGPAHLLLLEMPGEHALRMIERVQDQLCSTLAGLVSGPVEVAIGLVSAQGLDLQEAALRWAG